MHLLSLGVDQQTRVTNDVASIAAADSRTHVDSHLRELFIPISPLVSAMESHDDKLNLVCGSLTFIYMSWKEGKPDLSFISAFHCQTREYFGSVGRQAPALLLSLFTAVFLGREHSICVLCQSISDEKSAPGLSKQEAKKLRRLQVAYLQFAQSFVSEYPETFPLYVLRCDCKEVLLQKLRQVLKLIPGEIYLLMVIVHLSLLTTSSV